MDHVISTGGNGRLDGMTAADVEPMVAVALQADRLVLQFHGGLVSRAKGEDVARRPRPAVRSRVSQTAPDHGSPCPGDTASS